MLSLWNPFVPVIKERSDSRISTKNYFDRLFEDTFATMTQDLLGGHTINLGIEQKKNEDGSLSVSLDIPGIAVEDISIELQDNIVTIKGERKTTTSSYIVQKSFSVPQGYSSEEIRAELVNGVLTLALSPKEIPPKEVKKIPITSPHKQLT